MLVSTINEYEEKPFEPVIDAICDRLRPVLLTTLTTVFGLAPLLFETSQDAQFLKPTVVTLVFGLGFANAHYFIPGTEFNFHAKRYKVLLLFTRTIVNG